MTHRFQSHRLIPIPKHADGRRRSRTWQLPQSYPRSKSEIGSQMRGAVVRTWIMQGNERHQTPNRNPLSKPNQMMERIHLLSFLVVVTVFVVFFLLNSSYRVLSLPWLYLSMSVSYLIVHGCSHHRRRYGNVYILSSFFSIRVLSLFRDFYRVLFGLSVATRLHQHDNRLHQYNNRRLSKGAMFNFHWN